MAEITKVQLQNKTPFAATDVVTFGVPLLPGALTNPATVMRVQETGARVQWTPYVRPAEPERPAAMARRWPDGSFKYVKVTVPTGTVPAIGDAQITVVDDGTPINAGFDLGPNVDWANATVVFVVNGMPHILPLPLAELIEGDEPFAIRRRRRLIGRHPQMQQVWFSLQWDEKAREDHWSFLFQWGNSYHVIGSGRAGVPGFESPRVDITLAQLIVTGPTVTVRGRTKKLPRDVDVNGNVTTVTMIDSSVVIPNEQNSERITDGMHIAIAGAFSWGSSDSVQAQRWENANQRSSEVRAMSMNWPTFGVPLFGPGTLPDYPPGIASRAAGIALLEAINDAEEPRTVANMPAFGSLFVGIHDMRPNYGGTGDWEQAFAAIRGWPLLRTCWPTQLPEIQLDLRQQAARKYWWRKPNGAWFDPREFDAAGVISFDGRFWFNSPDLGGRNATIEGHFPTPGFDGPNRQHWGPVWAAIEPFVSMDPFSIDMVCRLRDLYTVSHFVHIGHGGGMPGPDALRAWGRTLQGLAWYLELAPDDFAISVMKDRIAMYENLDYGATHPNLPVLQVDGPDHRVLWRDVWKPWQEGQAIQGLYMASLALEGDDAPHTPRLFPWGQYTMRESPRLAALHMAQRAAAVVTMHGFHDRRGAEQVLLISTDGTGEHMSRANIRHRLDGRRITQGGVSGIIYCAQETSAANLRRVWIHSCDGQFAAGAVTIQGAAGDFSATCTLRLGGVKGINGIWDAGGRPLTDAERRETVGGIQPPISAVNVQSVPNGPFIDHTITITFAEPHGVPTDHRGVVWIDGNAEAALNREYSDAEFPTSNQVRVVLRLNPGAFAPTASGTVRMNWEFRNVKEGDGADFEMWSVQAVVLAWHWATQGVYGTESQAIAAKAESIINGLAYDSGRYLQNDWGTGKAAFPEYIGIVPFDLNGGQVPQPPAAPTNLQVSASSTSELRYTFQDNSSNESEFVLYESLDGIAGWTEIDTRPANTPFGTRGGLAPSTTRYLRVTARNAFGESEPTNVASGTTLAGGGDPPAAPTGLTTTLLLPRRHTFSFTINAAPGYSGHQVHRSTEGGAFVEIDRIPAGQATYDDQTVQPETDYTYRLRAFTPTLEGPFSDDLPITTPADPGTQPLVAPRMFSAAPHATDVAVDTAWTQDNVPAVSTDVERASGSLAQYDVGVCYHCTSTKFGSQGPPAPLVGSDNFVPNYHLPGVRALVQAQLAAIAAQGATFVKTALWFSDPHPSKDNYDCDWPINAQERQNLHDYATDVAATALPGGGYLRLDVAMNYHFGAWPDREDGHGGGGPWGAAYQAEFRENYQAVADALAGVKSPNGQIVARFVYLLSEMTFVSDRNDPRWVQWETEIGTFFLPEAVAYFGARDIACTVYGLCSQPEDIIFNNGFVDPLFPQINGHPILYQLYPMVAFLEGLASVGGPSVASEIHGDFYWTPNAGTLRRPADFIGRFLADFAAVWPGRKVHIPETWLWADKASRDDYGNGLLQHGNAIVASIAPWTTPAGGGPSRADVGPPFDLASLRPLNWQVIGNAPAGQNTLTDRTVTASADYSYRARHRDATRISPYSDVATVTAPSGEPPPLNAPTDMAAAGVSNTGIKTDWTDTNHAPHNEDETIVYESETDSGPWVEVGRAPANVTTFTREGLPPGDPVTRYYHTRARRGATLSDPSNVASGTTLAAGGTLPNAPTGFAFRPAAASDRLVADWTPPVGGGAVVSYAIEISTDEITWITRATPPAGETSATITGLDPGTAYFGRALALNEAGASAPSNVDSEATLAAGPPLAPTDGAVTVISSSSLKPTWQDQSSDEDGFVILRRLAGAGDFVQVGETAADVEEFTDAGLQPDTSYDYRIHSRRGAVLSTEFAEATGRTLKTITPGGQPPSPPTDAMAQATVSSATVAWSHTGVGVHRFRVTRQQDGVTVFDVEAAASDRELTEDGPFLAGQVLAYQVVAINDTFGSSNPSNLALATVQGEPQVERPPAPTLLRDLRVGVYDARVAWEYSGAPIDRFIVQRKDVEVHPLPYDDAESPAPVPDWMDVGTVHAGDPLEFHDIALAPESTYAYRVLAENEAGRSDPSNEIEVTTGTPAVGSHGNARGRVLNRFALLEDDFLRLLFRGTVLETEDEIEADERART